MNKRRLFASAMAACMLLSTMPSTALATDATTTNDQSLVQEQNTGADVPGSATGGAGSDGNVGEIVHTTLPEADENGTITLEKGATYTLGFKTLANGVRYAYNVPTDVSVIDLNGATVTATGSVGQYNDDRLFHVQGNQELVIKNGTIKMNEHGFAIRAYQGTNITLENVTLSGAEAGIITDGNLTIGAGSNISASVGTDENKSGDAIRTYNEATVIVNKGATITSTSPAGAGIECYSVGNLTIEEGATVQGTGYGLILYGGAVETSGIISGGTTAMLLSGSAPYSADNKDKTVTIKDGQLVDSIGDEETSIVVAASAETQSVTVDIQKGKFNGDIMNETTDSTQPTTISISGGYFVADPTDYLANGYVVVKSDLTDYKHKVVNEASAYKVSFQIGDAIYSVSADTTTFDGAATELKDALNAYAGSTLMFKGWKLSGTGDFKTGDIPAPTAPNTTYVAVFEKKADSSDVAVTPTPSVGDTYVIVPDTIPTEYKDAVESAVKDVNVTELNDLAGDMANNITDDEKNQAKTALAGEGITLGNDDSVTIHVQTYLNVKATNYQQSENCSVTLTLDITPMFQMIASTANNKADIDLEGDDRNSVVMDSGALKITQSVTVTIPLPADCGVADGSVVYVKHIAQENKVYIYTATVTDGKITFTNPHGFSEFTITSENPAAASVGETFYATLQDAVDAALSTPTAITTITVLKADQTVTVNAPGSFIVNGTATINCGSNITMTKTPVDGGVKYTFTTSTPSNPSYPSGGSDYTPSNPTYNVSVPTKVENGSVSVSAKNPTKGSTVTLTVTPDKGYELDTLTVTDKNGNKIALTDLGNGKYSFTMPASKVNVKATFVETVVAPEAPVTPFYDVAETDYFFDAVLWANENGITSGVGNGQFAPHATCTRAQMVTFLWNAAGCPNVSEDYADFTDVTANDYYYKAVLWAKANNITSGTGEGVFSPDQICTRAQMATFLYKFAEGKAVGTSNPFADVTANDYYAQPVQWAVENGITSGTGANTFGPNDPCTRAQMVTFLFRLLAE